MTGKTSIFTSPSVARFIGYAFIIIWLPLIPFINYFILAPIALASLLAGSFLLLISRRLSEYEKKLLTVSSGLEQLAAISNDAALSYDASFKIISWNEAAEKLFGLRKDEIIGKAISPGSAGDPRLSVLTQVIFPSLAPSVIKKSEPGIYPQIIDVDFAEPELNLTVKTDRILDPSGRPVGFIKTIKNRTRELELIRSKSEFITVAAHQLRTPLTAVHWTFEALSKSASGPDKEIVENGLEVSVKLLKIVNDLLDASKIEAGKFGYEFKEVDLVEFIDDLLKNANILAKKYGVSVYFDRPKTPVKIFADPGKLGLAVSNIIDNGIKYNVKNGRIVVRMEQLPNRPYIQISIKDTGIGIPPTGMKKLFTKFYRGENVVKEQTDGTGLGLYIAKNIIARHGGDISAESVLNRGTTFYIVLPTELSLIPPKELTIE